MTVEWGSTSCLSSVESKRREYLSSYLPTLWSITNHSRRMCPARCRLYEYEFTQFLYSTETQPVWRISRTGDRENKQCKIKQTNNAALMRKRRIDRMEWLLSNLLLDEAEYGLKNYTDPRGRHFVFAKHVRFSTIFSSTSKTNELMQTLPQGLGCHHFSGDILHYWRHSTGCRKPLPNLVNACWFWRIGQRIWANHKTEKYFDRKIIFVLIDE